jgi:hypothetical protein
MSSTCSNGNLCHDCDKITTEGRWDCEDCEDRSWFCADCCKVRDDAEIVYDCLKNGCGEDYCAEDCTCDCTDCQRNRDTDEEEDEDEDEDEEED